MEVGVDLDWYWSKTMMTTIEATAKNTNCIRMPNLSCAGTVDAVFWYENDDNRNNSNRGVN